MFCKNNSHKKMAAKYGLKENGEIFEIVIQNEAKYEASKIATFAKGGMYIRYLGLVVGFNFALKWIRWCLFITFDVASPD